MDIGKQKEQFSLAYIYAMAAQAGLNPSIPQVDDDSIDLQLSGKGFPGPFRSPMVQLQLKCTSQDVISGEVIKFKLSRKNYDDLRGANVICPRYLVVLLVPDENSSWIEHHDAFMSLHNKCYWISLRDYPATSNDTSVVVNIPVAQRLTTSSLSQFLTLASQGGA